MTTILPTSSMSAIDTVNAYFTAFSKQNIEGALEYVDENAIWHVDGDPILTTVGIIQGKTAIKKWLLCFPEGFQTLDFKLEKLIDSEPDVIAIGHFRHRIMSSNAIADGDFVIRFTANNGKITRYQIFEDSLMLSKSHHSSTPEFQTLINGTQYSWEDTGQGPTLIFLHGLFLDRTFWNPVIDHVKSQFRCVSFDMPGHGNSSWREGLDLGAIANDIALWIIENNISKVTLVGHSQGGMIALRIANKYPQLVEKLVLVNTSAQEEDPSRLPLWKKREAILLSSDESTRKNLFKMMQKIKYTNAWLQENPIYAEKDIKKQIDSDQMMQVQAMNAAVIMRGNISELLKEINIDAIVLAGSEDIATPPPHSKEIVQLLPNSTYVEVERAGHSIPVEAPEALVKCLLIK